MRIELSVIEKIEQYLMGTLSENERADFESQLNQNSQLKTQVGVQSQIMEGVQRLALKNATQKAYKNYKLKSFLTKALVIGIIAAAATYGVMKLVEEKEETPTPTEYKETQTLITFPENDSLSADANQYLDQEIFRIKTDQDTIIETKDGIVVYIPADAFDTSEPMVDFLIQGAVKTEDILMAGLSTITADGQELETGGMFYVDAFVNENRVDLKKELTVNVPSGDPKTGMQLYGGEKNANGEIVWNNPKPLESFLNPVEITTLAFYPPDYEANLNKMGYSEKAFMDSLYYSFACEEKQSGQLGHENGTKTLDERERSELKDRLRNLNNAGQAGIPRSVNDVITWEYSSKHLGNNIYSLIFMCTATDDFNVGELFPNEQPKNGHLPTEIYLFSNGKFLVKSGPLKTNTSSSHISSTHSSSETETKTTFEYKVEALSTCTIEGSLLFMACSDSYCFPLKDEKFSFDLTKTETTSCQGINPASIKTIWNSNYNKTNLATKEFEERMPWIHKTCDNKILELYINNLDKKLSTVDSMAFKYLNGDLREKFKEFAARGDGRVELDNQASKKLSAYYEKQRNAIAKALVETQQNYWNQQYEADVKNNQAQTQSENRNIENTADVFQKEYKKNLCKVYDELQLNKDCNAPAPANAVTVQITELGWKNIDRLVLEATAARETTTFSENGKTSTLTYTQWSATISDFEKYDRINVYNIPIEFNSYVKLNGTSGNYVYKLNADLKYQTVVLAWTADGIYFYKADAVTGNSNITLIKVSDEEWRNEIKNSLSSIANMNSELDYTAFMQKDQKRINTNKEKTLLRQKIETVVFPCGKNFKIISDTIISEPKTIAPENFGGATIAAAFDIDPSFPGGEQAMRSFISSKVIYPQEAKDKKISGMVYVNFEVHKDGTLSNIRVEKSLHPLLDVEAIRVVKLMPKWKPAQLNGQTVNCSYIIPIDFKIF